MAASPRRRSSRLDAEPVDYVVAMAKNDVLAARRTRHRSRRGRGARPAGRPSTSTPRRAMPPRRGRTSAAWSSRPKWSACRASPSRQSALRHHESAADARHLYARLCGRGDIENRIKELHDELAFGRTSCSRFWANQLRVLLTAAAYVLLQELRLRAARTAWPARKRHAAAGAAQDRRPGRPLGAPPRPPSARAPSHTSTRGAPFARPGRRRRLTRAARGPHVGYSCLCPSPATLRERQPSRPGPTRPRPSEPAVRPHHASNNTSPAGIYPPSARS